MKKLSQQLIQEGWYDYAVFLESSRNYTSYLKNSVYLVLKNGKRWAISAGNAFKQGAKDRIINILSCCKDTIAEAKKSTQMTCKHICSTFADQGENDIIFRGPGHEREGKVVSYIDGWMLIQKNPRY
jgi:hypothetical protein